MTRCDDSSRLGSTKGGRPLAGRTVVVTRPLGQVGSLADALIGLGAEVLAVPTIRIAPTPLNDEIRSAVRLLSEYDMVVFTSANAVTDFIDRVEECGVERRAVGQATVVAIGPKTAAALVERGLHCDVVPARFVAEGVLEALDERGMGLDGKRVLVPRAKEAREVIPDALRASGATVDVVTVYETVAAESLAVPAARIEAADFVTFTSGSTVDGFVTLMGEAELAQRLARTRLCSIGPVTSEALRARGLPVAVEARPYTAEGLVAAILAAVARG